LDSTWLKKYTDIHVLFQLFGCLSVNHFFASVFVQNGISIALSALLLRLTFYLVQQQLPLLIIFCHEHAAASLSVAA
jgi:hypothetical protein